mmetsp:Transcript_38512/g.101601  ORF Transcript_38512/g.101601 Transcript_38512/m.101601 type:complete len:201 (+) Transcript_38512:593-1195(+)
MAAPRRPIARTSGRSPARCTRDLWHSRRARRGERLSIWREVVAVVGSERGVPAGGRPPSGAGHSRWSHGQQNGAQQTYGKKSSSTTKMMSVVVPVNCSICHVPPGCAPGGAESTPPPPCMITTCGPGAATATACTGWAATGCASGTSNWKVIPGLCPGGTTTCIMPACVCTWKDCPSAKLSGTVADMSTMAKEAKEASRK